MKILFVPSDLAVFDTATRIMSDMLIIAIKMSQILSDSVTARSNYIHAF